MSQSFSVPQTPSCWYTVLGCIYEILGATLQLDRRDHVNLDQSSEQPSRLAHRKPDQFHVDHHVRNHDPPRSGHPPPLQNIHHCRIAQIKHAAVANKSDWINYPTPGTKNVWPGIFDLPRGTHFSGFTYFVVYSYNIFQKNDLVLKSFPRILQEKFQLTAFTK